jgi:hypothetical protein
MNQQPYRLWDTVIKALGFGGLVASLSFSACQYSGNIEKEYKKPFWEFQLKTCINASKAASSIAQFSGALPSGKIPEEYINELFKLYYGEAQLALDNKTFKALGEIGSLAIQCNANTQSKEICIRPVFNGKSLSVSKACRDMVTKAWNVPLEELDSSELNNILTK